MPYRGSYPCAQATIETTTMTKSIKVSHSAANMDGHSKVVHDRPLRQCSQGSQIAVLVSSSCRFVESAVWPDVIEVGMRSKHLGTTSLSWEFGLFRQSDGALLATGEFVHVIIDREGARRPIPLPAELRELVTGSMVAQQPAVAD